MGVAPFVSASASASSSAASGDTNVMTSSYTASSVATPSPVWLATGTGTGSVLQAPGISLLPAWLRSRLPTILSQKRPAQTFYDYLFLQGGIGLYMGWTAAVTILDVSVTLVAGGVTASGLGAATAGAIMLFVAAALAVIAAFVPIDFWFSGALCWTLIGIHTQNLNPDWPIHEPAVLTAACDDCRCNRGYRNMLRHCRASEAYDDGPHQICPR